MSSKFTDSLVGIDLSKFTKFTVPAVNKVSDEWTLGSIYNGFSPVGRYAEDLRPSIASLMMLHEAYMSASCDMACDYASSLPSYSYLVGYVIFNLIDKSDFEYTRSLPLLIAPDVVHVEKSDLTNKGFTNSVTLRSGVRGLFCDYGMIVKASADASMDTQGTFMHELFHACMRYTPYIKDEMYGEDIAAVIEESAAHLLADKRSILFNAASSTFSTSIRSVPGKSSSGKAELQYHSCEDLIVRGKSLVHKTITLDLTDLKNLEATTEECMKYFSAGTVNTIVQNNMKGEFFNVKKRQQK